MAIEKRNGQITNSFLVLKYVYQQRQKILPSCITLTNPEMAILNLM